MADSILKASTELDALVPEVWSRKYYDALLENLPFSSVISKDYEGEIQGLGDTVRINSIPEFDVADTLAEDARADAASVTVTQQSLVINKRFVRDFIVTSLAQIQSIPAMDKLRDLAIYSIQKAINNYIVSIIIPSASAPDHSIAYDSGTTMALADLLEAKELLDAQDVPSPDRHLVMGSAQVNDIFNITGFTSSDFLVAGAPLASGQLPMALLGFMPHFASGVGNTSYLFHSSFFTMATQKGMSVSMYDLGVDGKRAMRVNVDTLAGFKQLDNLRVVTLA